MPAREQLEVLFVEPDELDQLLPFCVHEPADLTARKHGVPLTRLPEPWLRSVRVRPDFRLDLQMAEMFSFEPSVRRDSRNGAGSTQGVSLTRSCAAR